MSRSAIRDSFIDKRSRAFLIVAAASALVIASALGSAAGAQVSSPAPSATMSVADVRDSFISSGFQVDRPHAWTWMNPPFTSLQVHDPASQRVLMLMIYADSASAQRARSQALAHEPGQAEPHLIEGYGPSVWSDNVALVETTQMELDKLSQARSDEANGVEVDTNLAWEHSVSNDAVDLEFQQALVNTRRVVNL